jgi:hypothetical protein
MNGMPIARWKLMDKETKEAQERRDAVPAEELPEPEPSDYNLPFTD